MANWGASDFNDVVTEEEKDALAARIKAETDNTGLSRWPHNDEVERGYPPKDVRHFCVNDKEWQIHRLAMKGKTTHEKLAMLKQWWDTHEREEYYATQVQVGNYLGALRRGGQLDDSNRVRRWR